MVKWWFREFGLIALQWNWSMKLILTVIMIITLSGCITGYSADREKLVAISPWGITEIMWFVLAQSSVKFTVYFAEVSLWRKLLNIVVNYNWPQYLSFRSRFISSFCCNQRLSSCQAQSLSVQIRVAQSSYTAKLHDLPGYDHRCQLTGFICWHRHN